MASNKAITIDSNLSFEEHITSMCKKAGEILNSLAKITGYMDV